jgi:excisionase family DNA binding protein
MNTTSQITLTLNITGQLTIDPQNLEQLSLACKSQAPTSHQSSSPAFATTDQKSLPRLAYTTKEAAEILGMSPGTIYKLIIRGLLKSSCATRTKIISRTEIERFLRETSRFEY